MRALLYAVVALALCGCPNKGGSVQKKPEPCRKFGDSCEFSPGKLGSCIERANCSSGDCLICQSQH